MSSSPRGKETRSARVVLCFVAAMAIHVLAASLAQRALSSQNTADAASHELASRRAHASASPWHVLRTTPVPPAKAKLSDPADAPARPEAQEEPDKPDKPDEPDDEPRPQRVPIGRDDAPERLTAAWISFDAFQQMQARQGEHEQPAVQRQAQPTADAPMRLDATPPAPAPAPGSASASATGPGSAPGSTPETGAGNAPGTSPTAPSVQHAKPTPGRPALAGLDQPNADAQDPGPIEAAEALPDAPAFTHTVPDADVPAPAPASSGASSTAPSDASSDAPASASPRASASTPTASSSAASKGAPTPVEAGGPSRSSRQADSSSAQRETRSADSSSSQQEARPTAAPRQRRESQPVQLDMTDKPLQPGSVITGPGVEIATVAPPLSLITRLSVPVRQVTVKVKFAPDGSVDEAQIVQSSGDPGVDAPVLASLYQWRASGKRFEALEGPLVLRISVVLK